MPKRSKEPDEALGPAIDGFSIPMTNMLMVREPEEEPEEIEEPEEEVVEHPVALICGEGPIAEAVGRLAEDCGFIVEFVIRDDGLHEDGGENDFTIRLSDFDNFVADCGVDRNFFVCIFLENADDCETILYQCLESPARYIGLLADAEKRKKIFENLRSGGVPDAELATVHCPIGLNIGATTPEQLAVGVTAELMASRNGTMKRVLNNMELCHSRADFPSAVQAGCQAQSLGIRKISTLNGHEKV